MREQTNLSQRRMSLKWWGESKLENIFALTDALKTKNPETALRLLNNQIDHGEEPIKILGTIAWQFRMIWEVKHFQKQNLPSGQIAKAMGANPFVVDKALQHTRGSAHNNYAQDIWNWLKPIEA